ncbi:transcription repressor OFP13 [Juglans microcarpa x Juglans regia]|uniref:transcription repressor OFP13 n=1 Tax=Juglans microcarpa x Juglans regia TaxID=2249226 RepID=UPI001B7E0325|nr:transcription repressor OFP13 [Juglans microcarpa x Juglans regia]
MGKKIMKLSSLFKNKETKQQPWQWPSCKHPKTFSFRAGDDMFKTVNSVFFDSTMDGVDQVETPESWFTNSSESASYSTESEEYFDGESLEMVVRGVRSERLFFEPGDTSSILEKKLAKDHVHHGSFPFKESVVLAMESKDPYIDFKRSMEEMVESHGVKDWGCLEELLGWYLRMNGKKNHGFIVGAFVDLLVGLAATTSSCSHDSTSYFSAISSSSSNSLSSSALLCSSVDHGQIEIEEVDKTRR